jgi:drug/metabolite transporter (DMT)-like permease
MTPQKSSLFTDLSLLFIAIIWALNFTVIKASLSEIDPYSFNAIRFVLAASFMWIVVAKRKAWFRIQKQDFWPLLALGLAGNLLYQWLFIVGIDLTLAANAAVMLGTIPIWVAVASHLLSFESMNRLKGIGVILAFAGVLMIIFFSANPISFGSDSFTGDVVIVLAAVVWAMYTIYSKQFLSRYSPLQFSAVMATIGAIALVLLAIPYAGKTDWAEVSIPAYGGALYSGLLAIGVAYLIWNNGIQTVGAVRTATYQNLVPVLGLVFGIVLLGESLEPLQYFGSAIVISGILITRHGGRIP